MTPEYQQRPRTLTPDQREAVHERAAIATRPARVPTWAQG